ncbi:DUF4085 family protein [Clostridium sp. C2-6-12]|uniref:DUF4085 family protein n=1 Tax=Clostridium sp. C2-6-12 TaxID=2698832 RepID=UPI0013692475|nr:DUF4085 family protein [Clostridium sp. C2-6-12]
MMYFTRESYEKMQIRGRFPLKIDNKENWIEQLEEFSTLSSYYDKVYYELLLQHIPEVKADILQGKNMTDKEVAEKLYTRINEMANEWKDLCNSYKAEYEDIKYKLPLSMQVLSKYNFHDSEVLSFKKDINDNLVLELDRYSLIFKKVSKFEIIEDIVGDTWLYEEVHLSHIGEFEFQVLLYSSEGFLNLNEIKIIADDVCIEVKEL